MKKNRQRKTAVHTGQNTSPFPLASIKVIGVGGGGGNAISRMSRSFVRGVEFIAINTDHQDLDQCAVRHRVYIGKNLTKGLGTGMNPDLGRQAAEENRSEIAETVKGADLVFIAAGLGGGTGGGVSPVVAEAAKQAGALTFAFVTKPFSFEGSQRQRVAEECLLRLKDKVDALIVVPNDRIFSVIRKETPLLKAFAAIDDVLKNALEGIVELIVTPGIINVDFADVRAIVADSGAAIVGLGIASGEGRAQQAVNMALHSPLLELNPEGAKGVILSVSGGRDLRMAEINEAAKIVAQTVDPGAKIIFGAYYDRRMNPKQLKVTLVATGFDGHAPMSLFAGHSNDQKPVSLMGRKGFTFEELKSEERAAEKAAPELQPRDSQSAMPSAAAGDAKSEGRFDKLKNKKSDADVWDIPTFLRRRKK